VTHSLWSPELRFDITLFERIVFMRPGVTEAVSLKAEPGITLSGRITDTKNQPLGNVNVLLRTQSESAVVLGTLSDTEGRYVLNNAPAGTHTLELLRHAKPTAPI
jgi:Carboxypeptidase regulatory-like domain